MTLQADKSTDGKTLTIKMPQEFDFRSHKEFRETHRNPGTVSQYVLDFSRTKHMDSSALGMLLLMREEIGNDSNKIRLINCQHNIKALLEMANFHKLFTVV
ncbi:MAG: STAS domain-containing protein [Gammaproteobacteria bacterium]|nr:STAS domain-containing protein [Gammaproteobacteria bacterium]